MNKFISYFGALFMEKAENDKWRVSIGRTSWWLVLIPALYTWIGSTQDITAHHLTVLLLLAGYNFGKHGLNVFKNKTSANNNQNLNGPG
ncbi:hypothetical protein LCGC14_1483870 [marine sediment metagenome]|uniref:Uncharacterized protein n=1 Tax=marine sediment metagenome TaxID=412755 RepID=A0A0F9J8P8_9ZZZZ